MFHVRPLAAAVDLMRAWYNSSVSSRERESRHPKLGPVTENNATNDDEA
jgi:hypothetical protein